MEQRPQQFRPSAAEHPEPLQPETGAAQAPAGVVQSAEVIGNHVDSACSDSFCRKPGAPRDDRSLIHCRAAVGRNGCLHLYPTHDEVHSVVRRDMPSGTPVAGENPGTFREIGANFSRHGHSVHPAVKVSQPGFSRDSRSGPARHAQGVPIHRRCAGHVSTRTFGSQRAALNERSPFRESNQGAQGGPRGAATTQFVGRNLPGDAIQVFVCPQVHGAVGKSRSGQRSTRDFIFSHLLKGVSRANPCCVAGFVEKQDVPICKHR